MSQTNRAVLGVIAFALLAGAFWILALGPKRDRATELGDRIAALEKQVASARSEAEAAAAAKTGYDSDYQQLVLLGKAVPASDDTASLLVELNRISSGAGAKFDGISLDETASASSVPATPVPTPTTPSTGAVAGAPVPATEAAAALLPIGASIGAAGLGVMPYKLTFTGGFFETANFIAGLDDLVRTESSHVAVDGRLVTIDGFSLQPDPDRGFPALVASFSVTTYVTPPTQGLTAGATPTAPTPASPTQAATATATQTSSTAPTTP